MSREKAKLFKLLSQPASSLPTLPASSWRPPRTPPSTGPRQGLPPAASLQVPPTLGSVVVAPGVGRPGATGARGCPALLSPGNQQRPLGPSAGICRGEEEEDKKAGWDSGQQRQDKRLCRRAVHRASGLSSYRPPGGSWSVQRARPATHLPPGDRVWGSR